MGNLTTLINDSVSEGLPLQLKHIFRTTVAKKSKERLPLQKNESKVDVILRQPTIDKEARKSLVNCIFNIELSYHLDTITAFTAVEIFGRFLSAQVISGKEEAMYASVVAVHISSKYHETGLFRRPVLSELLECVTRGSPDLNGLNCRLGMAMEDRILNALDMEIDVPSVHTFLIRFYKAAKIWPDTKTTLMASFYAKLGIWDYDLKMTYPTEKLAAAALYAACVLTHNIRMWRDTYRSHTVFKDTELWKCTKRMMELHLVGLGGHESCCSWIIKNMILISQLPKKLHTSSVR
uniref:cyclin-B1-3-like n=1 Tax=Erigeron canadensis TaxID=72917 RepID=UPI001CB8FD9D|nr:cyclin-B1-3-like [Erigeron canadensis]